jgi:hypothetical protein
MFICARALEGKNLTDSSMSSLLSAWTARDAPGAGETFALALPQGMERDHAIGVIAGQAARRTELTHAKELFDNLSSPAKLWPAVSGVLVNLAQNHPEAGRAWLMDMKSQMEPKAFASAAKDFNEHVVRVAPSMAVDP